MANIMNSGINGQISDLFAGFGIQVQNNLKDTLLGLCSDLEIDAGTFKKTWDANYSMSTGVILGDAVVVKKEQAEKKEQENTRRKPVGKSAYHCYLAKWREAKKDGDDTRSFADVRSDWGNLSQEEKDTYKSEDSSPAAVPAPAPEPEQAEEEEIVDNSIPKINGVPLVEEEWTVAKLKVELKARSLKQSGKKSELIQRLIDSFSQDDESEEEESEEEESESESSDDEDDESDNESDDENDEDEGDIDDIENAVDDIIKQVTAANNGDDELSDEDVSDEEDNSE